MSANRTISAFKNQEEQQPNNMRRIIFTIRDFSRQIYNYPYARAISGQWYPDFPCLPGNPWSHFLAGCSTTTAWGFLKSMLPNAEAAPNGTPFTEMILRTADRATERGVAYFSPFFGDLAVVVVDPRMIQQVIFQSDSVNRQESFNMMAPIMGLQNLFDTPINNDGLWKKRRAEIRKQIHGRFLQTDFTAMVQPIATLHVGRLAKEKAADLKQVTTDFALECILNAFGMSEFKDDTHAKHDRLYKLMHDAISEAVDTRTLVWRRLGLGVPRRLKTIMSQFHQLIKEELIHPNRENILSSDNWYQQKISGESHATTTPLQLDAQYAIDYFIQLLIAHTETISKLLQFSLIALSQYPEKAQRIREDIAALTRHLTPGERENFHLIHKEVESLVYLKAFLFEVLRLTPVVPAQDLEVSVDEGVTLYDMPYCKNREDYSAAKKQIDAELEKLPPEQRKAAEAKQKMHIPRGAFILLPMVNTHRIPDEKNSEDTYIKDAKDAAMFRPERHLVRGEKGEMKLRPMNPARLFPFGFRERKCPGADLAIREASLFLVHVLRTYNVHTSENYPPAITPGFSSSLNNNPTITLAKAGECKLEPQSPRARKSYSI